MTKEFRRKSGAVKVGNVTIGGSSPIVIQSMGTVSTNDIEGATAQAISIAKSGAELVRFTAQGVIEAQNMGLIHQRMNTAGITTPLVADIHFNPRAAFVAAEKVEKVRINPGNFSDIEKLDENFSNLIEICKHNHTALRIGVNHGSLSGRIVAKYGDTIEGMVESAMEFLRIARKRDFHEIVVSLKSSNTQVMVRAYRLLCSVMKKEQMDYPLHLGVTEAGDGIQGRVRSAVGIGALLSEGIGDTIRVSLTEKPENEVVFAKKLIIYIDSLKIYPLVESDTNYYNAHAVAPFLTDTINEDMIVVDEPTPQMARAKLLTIKSDKKVVIRRHYSLEKEMFIAAVSVDLGGLLIDGFADGLSITNDQLSQVEVDEIVLDVLQATRRLITKPEYISCPGCGRTLYDIQRVLAQVKERTKGIKNIKIAVMGCIVNGPGEMADADYGYVGAARGKVTLYKKGEIYKKNIDQQEALDELVKLLKENNEFLK
ncbi:MAG: (E)-4-hydroxy-3-methylbut-2-enyl-diphosphate synthase [Rikenellaceae bacterium]